MADTNTNNNSVGGDVDSERTYTTAEVAALLGLLDPATVAAGEAAGSARPA